MYPSQSTFQSGAALSAWWQTNKADGSLQICATQGRTFIRQLQDSINNHVSGTAWNNPFNGTDFHAGSIGVDGNWGSLTTQGLYILAQAKNATTDILSAIQQDYASNTSGQAGNQFSYWTLLAAIWVSQHPDLDLSKIHLNDGAIAPRWDVEPPDDSPNQGIVTCWDQNATPPTVTNARTGQVTGGTPTANSGIASGNPISQPGLFGSTAGGTANGGAIVVAAAVGISLLAAGISAIVAKKKHRRSRR